jgi:hypothetical protein
MLMLLALRLSSLLPRLVSSTGNMFLTIFVHLNLPAGKRRYPRHPIIVILKLLIPSGTRRAIDTSVGHLTNTQRAENVSFFKWLPDEREMWVQGTMPYQRGCELSHGAWLLGGDR